MRIVIIGADGQLGAELVKACEGRAIGLTIEDLDITDGPRTRETIAALAPDAVVNTAAYHNVPECERQPARAFAVNAAAVKNIVDACRPAGIRLVHISTDYVFDGRKNGPYTEDDPPRPLNVYGISKAAGEWVARQHPLHWIVRTSSLFGIRGSMAKGGWNFVKHMLEAARTGHPVAVSSNIVCSPTYAPDAARRIREILEADAAPGIYHVANGGRCTWLEFAAEIFRQWGAAVWLESRVETEEIAGLRRPLNSSLASAKLPPLRPWQEALADYLAEERLAEAGPARGD